MKPGIKYGDLKAFIDIYCSTQSQCVYWRTISAHWGLSATSNFLKIKNTLKEPLKRISSSSPRVLYLLPTSHSFFRNPLKNPYSFDVTEAYLDNSFPPFFYPLTDSLIVFGLLDPHSSFTIFPQSIPGLTARLRSLTIPFRKAWKGNTCQIFIPQINPLFLSSLTWPARVPESEKHCYMITPIPIEARLTVSSLVSSVPDVVFSQMITFYPIPGKTVYKC